MIPKIELASSGLKTSRLALGTSRLHYCGKQERHRLLAAAADLGFAHLDTAPSYGDGLAEREVGEFVKGRRPEFVVATKYGIPPHPIADALPALTMPLLAARAIARRIGFASDRLPQISAAGLRESVERSLRRLNMETIDILFLHEPSRLRIPDPDLLVFEAQHLYQRGLVRRFGLAGGWAGVAEVKDRLNRIFSIIQTKETDWPVESPPDLTYGAIAAGPQRFKGNAASDNVEIAARLRTALARRRNGTIIVSTTKVEHLSELAAAASDMRAST